jgi:hypothetical protein
MTSDHLPARLLAEQEAWVPNCQPHDVPILVAAHLLKLLGNPLPNSVKFFASYEIMDLAKDRNWLVRVTNTLSQHWQKKNSDKQEFTTI